MTVLSTSFKEKVDIFKLQVDEIKVVEKKNSTTTTILDKQLKSLKIKFIGVNKVSQTLEKTSRTFDQQIADLGLASKSQAQKLEELSRQQDALVLSQEAFATKQDALVAEVDEIKSLLNQILQRLPG